MAASSWGTLCVMRIRAPLIAGVTIVMLAAFAVLTFRSSSEPGWASRIWFRAEYRMSRDITEKVGDFRRHQGRLPLSLDEVGVPESEIFPRYKRISTSDYEVWFGTVLGESLTYESSTRAWR